MFDFIKNLFKRKGQSESVRYRTQDGPGYSWRFNAPPMFKDVEGDGESYCDELVIDNWFHLEQMTDRVWWMRIGNDLNIHVSLNDDGPPRISIQDYGDSDAVAEMIEPHVKEAIAQKLLNR